MKGKKVLAKFNADEITKPLPKPVMKAINQLAHTKACVFEMEERQRLCDDAQERLKAGKTAPEIIAALTKELIEERTTYE